MMNTTRRGAARLIGLSAALGTLGLGAQAHDDADDGFRAGTVFTSSNGTAGNELWIFSAERGRLVLRSRVATGGQGAGAGLGSQGAVTLSTDGRHLFVVNAISNTVSTFAVGERGVQLVSVIDSGGLRPISVAEHDGFVVVLNAAGAGNVAGFRNDRGQLSPLAGSVKPLSAAGGTNPAQVGFDDDGELLLVTEKGTNRLTSYRVDRAGRLDGPVVTPSASPVPFGFAFDRRNNALVSEAGQSALSSYHFDERGPAVPRVVTAAVATTQAAACWVAVTPNGRHVYTINAGSGTVSGFRLARSGRIELARAVAATIGAGAGTGPTDAMVSPDGRRLFVLGGRSLTISSFRIGADGSLADGSEVGGLPAGVVGLAAN